MAQRVRKLNLSKLHFLGYSVGIDSNTLIVRIPHYYNLIEFMRDDTPYNFESINTIVLIESNDYFFIGKIIKESLSAQDTKRIIKDNTKLTETPELFIKILAEINPIGLEMIKSNICSPVIHSKVYIADKKLINNFIKDVSNYSSDNKDIETKDFAKLSEQSHLRINLPLDTLFDKHLCIVGSTGSGKSYTAAKLILELIRQNQHVILIDPTGEYKNIIKALKNGVIKTYDGNNVIVSDFYIGKDTMIPYFDLDENELYKLIHPSRSLQVPKLKAAIKDLKYINLLDHYNMLEKHSDIIYHDKYKHNYLKIINNESNISDINNLKTEIISCLANKSNYGYNFSELPLQLKQECYQVYDNYKKINNYSNKKKHIRHINLNNFMWQYCASLANRIDSFCHDSLLTQYFCSTFKNSSESTKLFYRALNYDNLIKKNIIYIDLEDLISVNNIPEIIGDYIARKLLLSFIKAKKAKKNTKCPAVLFLDEAHKFIKLDNPDDALNLHYFDLVAREGRKYGLFMTLITQSPYDLSRSVLTQFGTFIIHHLGNKNEREQVTGTLPYNSNLDKYVSSLNTGEAIISSNNLYIPLKVYINRPSIPPKSNTPRFGH